MLIYKCDKCKNIIEGSHPYITGKFLAEGDFDRLDFCLTCWPIIFKNMYNEVKPNKNGPKFSLGLDLG